MSTESGQGSTVGVDWIAPHLGEPGVRLVEIDVSRAAYDGGHIPGAVLWNAYADLRDPNYKPVGLAELAGLLSRSGITPEMCVVTYGYSAPLGFWLLRAHGHEDVRMLMGPRDQWAQTGHEWSTDAPAMADSAYPPMVANDDVLVSREAMWSAIDDPSQLVLDVRAEGEYDGELFWPSGATEDIGRTGHVPGAVNVPIGLLRADDGTLRSADELRGVFERAGQSTDHLLHDRQQGERSMVRTQVSPRLPGRAGLLRLVGRVGQGDRHADRNLSLTRARQRSWYRRLPPPPGARSRCATKRGLGAKPAARS